MLSFDEAIEIIHGLPRRGDTETVPLIDGDGRVLAEDVRLDRDVPGFDRATMDGFAVALDGDRRSFEVIGTIHAGENKDLAPAAGQAVRIMTGAPCPPDVTVVPVECTDAHNGSQTDAATVTITPGATSRGRAKTAARAIRWRGPDSASIP